jgi:RIO-like serine/threonine protein kinase
VIVTAGALEPGIAIAVLRDGPSTPSDRHREGIVHGDVERSNIMLTRTGNAKLIDIAAAFAREDAPLARRPTPRPTS